MADIRKDNTTAITYSLLQKCKVPTTKLFLQKELQSHPYYPSLAAVSDILNTYNVENTALQVDFNYLTNNELPIIAHLNINGGIFALIKGIGKENVHISTDGENNFLIEKKKFLDVWDKVILVAKSNKESIEPGYYKNKKTERLQKILLPSFVFILMGILVGIFIFQNVPLFIIPLFFTKFIGLIFIWLLLQHELGEYNKFIDKLCTMTKSAGCNEVLKSKASSIIGFVKMSDLGFVWFTTTLIFLIISCTYNMYTSALNLLGWLSLLTLPYVIFSIGYQAFVIKKYCPMCLGVMSMLVLESLFFYYLGIFVKPETNVIFNFLLMLVLSICMLVCYKALMINFVKNKDFEIKYLNLKRNPLILDALLTDSDEVDIEALPSPIIIGDNSATTIITEVINPYCNPCEKAVNDIKNFLIQIPNQKIKIQFTFAVPAEDDTDFRTKTALHMLALSDTFNSEKMKEAMSDWFIMKKFDLWSAKYPAKVTNRHHNILIKQSDWNKKYKITGTPTAFINNKRLPIKIKLSDLKFFID